jgi:Domain of unknown function DUF11
MILRNKACLLWVWSLMLLAVAHSQIQQISADSFEKAKLSTQWKITKTSKGRAYVTGSYGPLEGSQYMILDDAVSDEIYSLSEATLKANMKGMYHGTLSFMAKGFGSEFIAPPSDHLDKTQRSFDGVSVSADGGKTWILVKSFASLTADWQFYTVQLDDYFDPLSYQDGLLVRFSSFSRAAAPLDGIAIDGVVIRAESSPPLVTLMLPPLILEGQSGKGRITLTKALPEASWAEFHFDGDAAIQLNWEMLIPAGKKTYDFTLSALNDGVAQPYREIQAKVLVASKYSATAKFGVADNQPLGVILSVPEILPEAVAQSNNCSIQIDRPSTSATTIKLSSSPPGQISLPAKVIIPAGQRSVSFTAMAPNDKKADGDIPVKIRATFSKQSFSEATTLVRDLQPQVIRFAADKIRIVEGKPSFVRVQIGGSLVLPTTVHLQASPELGLELPQTIVVPAGADGYDVPIKAVSDFQLKSRSGEISATAEGFDSGRCDCEIIEGDPSGYEMATDFDLEIVGKPLPLQVIAKDVDGNIMPSASTNPICSAVYPDGHESVMTTETLSLTDGIWSGNVLLPADSVAPMRIRVKSPGTAEAISRHFDLMREYSWPVADFVEDTSRHCIYVAVGSSASSSVSLSLLAIEPFTGQILKSLPLEQAPQKVVISDDFKTLYVSSNASGVGRIDRIDLESFTKKDTIDVGSTGSGYNVSVQDMCPIPGHPDWLVVSRYRPNYSPSFDSMLLYKDGVAAVYPVTSIYGDMGLIRYAPDLNRLISTSGFGFSTLSYNDSGLYKWGSYPGNLNFISSGMTWALKNSRIFDSSGEVLNYETCLADGNLGIKGSVCADNASDHVFYLESLLKNEPITSEYRQLSSYDSASLARQRQISMPTSYKSPGRLDRWGTAGLAFCHSGGMVILDAPQFVVTSKTVDLSVTVEAPGTASQIGEVMSQTIRVRNRGTAASGPVNLVVRTSAGQEFVSQQGATMFYRSGDTVYLSLPDITVGGEAVISVKTRRDTQGLAMLYVQANSLYGDINLADNEGGSLRLVGYTADYFQASSDGLEVSNCLYDSTANKIWYAVASSQFPALKNCLFSLRPDTGEVLNLIRLQDAPTCLALSDNGKKLYVGLANTPAIQKIDCSNSFTSTQISLGYVTNLNVKEAIYASDIKVFKGDEDWILVSKMTRNSYKSFYSLAVYNGTSWSVSITSMPSAKPYQLEESDQPGIYYGYDPTNAYSISAAVCKIQVTQKSISVVPYTTTDSLSKYDPENNEYFLGDEMIRAKGGKIFFFRGAVLNGSSGDPIGWTTRGPLEVDVARGRVYSLEDLGTNSSYYTKLCVFDYFGFRRIGEYQLPKPVTANARSIMRWGKSGLSFITTNGFFILSNEELVPQETTGKLEVKVSFTSKTATRGGLVQYRVDVKNVGTAPVSDASVSVVTSPNLTLNEVVQGSAYLKLMGLGNGYLFEPPTIAVGETATLLLNFNVTDTGLTSCSAWPTLASSATASAPVQSCAWTLAVQPPGSEPLYERSNIPLTSMLYDAGRKLFWLGVKDWSTVDVSQSLISYDPQTGGIGSVIKLGGNPGQFEISKNGKYLYVALTDKPLIQRVNLDTSVVEATLTLRKKSDGSQLYATDIQAMSGDGKSIIVPLKDSQTTLTPYAVDLYEDTVSETLSGFSGQNVFRITPTSTDGIFYALTTTTLKKIGVSGKNVTVLSQVNGAWTSDDYRESNNWLWSVDGRVFDGDAMRLLYTDVLEGLVQPNVSQGKVSCLSYKNTLKAPTYGDLDIYDPYTMIKLRTLDIPDSTNANSLTEWDGGQAFLSDEGFNLIRDAKVDNLGTGDVSVSLKLLPVSPKSGQKATFELTLTNVGTNRISPSGVLYFDQPDSSYGFIYNAVSKESGNVTLQDRHLIYTPGPLEPGASTKMTVTGYFPSTSNYKPTAGATPGCVDLNPADNWTQLFVITTMY